MTELIRYSLAMVVNSGAGASAPDLSKQRSIVAEVRPQGLRTTL